MIIHTNDYMKIRISTFESEYKIDYILTNFITRYEDTYIDVQTIDSVESVTKAGFYQHVDFGHETDKIRTVISMNIFEINTYFALDFDQSSVDKLSQSEYLVIVLPQKYNSVYRMDIGDEILLSFSSTMKDIPFTIGGFFEKQQSNQAFTNMHLINGYETTTYNALLINRTADEVGLKTELINRYGQNMVYIIDFKEIISINVFEMIQTTSYITLILSVIVLCFILTIVNHSILLLGQMKNTYAKFYVVGLSIKGIQKYLVKESLLLFVLLYFTSTIGYILIASQLKGLLIFLGEYENISIYFNTIWTSGLVLIVVYALTKIVYLQGVSQIEPSNVLKYY